MLYFINFYKLLDSKATVAPPEKATLAPSEKVTPDEPKKPYTGKIKLQRNEKGVFGMDLTRPRFKKKFRVENLVEGSTAAQYFKEGDKLNSIEIEGKDITNRSFKTFLMLWRNVDSIVITKKVK